MNKERLKEFILPKFKYGISSVVATSVDYSVFFILVSLTSTSLIPLNQGLAYTSGLLTNFFLQKRFVFSVNRSVLTTFSLSVTFSLIGMALSTLAIFLITKIPFFLNHLILSKLLITGSLFLYNFYTKRFAFEKKGVFTTLNSEETEHKTES